MTATTPSSPAATEPDVAAVVDRFLAAITGGAGVPIDLYAADATLDATVPNWRMTKVGPAEITDEYGRWFADPGTFEELERVAIPGGEVVTYLLVWEEAGVPFAAHHCHTLTVRDGLIVADRVFCGGRWDAGLLAQMAEAGS